jgi:malate dehydrogenase
MISIIGTGRVGSAIAFLAASNSLDDILLVNRTKEKALGQAMDISNAIPPDSKISVVATDFTEITNSKVVIISASTGIYTENRMELVSEQAKMIKDIAKKIQKYTPQSNILIVSNPVDVLTYIFQKEGGIDPQRIMGVASSLDSGRLRYLLAQTLHTNQSEINNALVMGEHGDSMVPIFSVASWKKKPILEILTCEQIHNITGNLRFYWKTLRVYKGPSIFGIAKNTYDILESIVKHKKINVPASVLLNGQYGISDVCLGVPIKTTRNGLYSINEISLNQSELDSLRKSAEIVKGYQNLCK